MVQKNRLHFSESNGILFAIFRVTKLKIRILQIYTFFCYFCQFRKSKNIPENIPLTSAWTGQRSNYGQHAIWAVRTIRRTRMNLRNLTQFNEEDNGGGQTMVVAAAPAVLRPVVVAASSLPVSPVFPCPPSCSGELFPRSRWRRRGRTPASYWRRDF
jgi:hypothetical protein